MPLLPVITVVATTSKVTMTTLAFSYSINHRRWFHRFQFSAFVSPISSIFFPTFLLLPPVIFILTPFFFFLFFLLSFSRIPLLSFFLYHCLIGLFPTILLPLLFIILLLHLRHPPVVDVVNDFLYTSTVFTQLCAGI